jgi:hypothetical protein
MRACQKIVRSFLISGMGILPALGREVQAGSLNSETA